MAIDRYQARPTQVSGGGVPDLNLSRGSQAMSDALAEIGSTVGRTADALRQKAIRDEQPALVRLHGTMAAKAQMIAKEAEAQEDPGSYFAEKWKGYADGIRGEYKGADPRGLDGRMAAIEATHTEAVAAFTANRQRTEEVNAWQSGAEDLLSELESATMAGKENTPDFAQRQADLETVLQAGLDRKIIDPAKAQEWRDGAMAAQARGLLSNRTMAIYQKGGLRAGFNAANEALDAFLKDDSQVKDLDTRLKIVAFAKAQLGEQRAKDQEAYNVRLATFAASLVGGNARNEDQSKKIKAQGWMMPEDRAQLMGNNALAMVRAARERDARVEAWNKVRLSLAPTLNAQDVGKVVTRPDGTKEVIGSGDLEGDRKKLADGLANRINEGIRDGTLKAADLEGLKGVYSPDAIERLRDAVDTRDKTILKAEAAKLEAVTLAEAYDMRRKGTLTPEYLDQHMAILGVEKVEALKGSLEQSAAAHEKLLAKSMEDAVWYEMNARADAGTLTIDEIDRTAKSEHNLLPADKLVTLRNKVLSGDKKGHELAAAGADWAAGRPMTQERATALFDAFGKNPPPAAGQPDIPNLVPGQTAAATPQASLELYNDAALPAIADFIDRVGTVPKQVMQAMEQATTDRDPKRVAWVASLYNDIASNPRRAGPILDTIPQKTQDFLRSVYSSRLQGDDLGAELGKIRDDSFNGSTRETAKAARTAAGPEGEQRLWGLSDAMQNRNTIGQSTLYASPGLEDGIVGTVAAYGFGWKTPGVITEEFKQQWNEVAWRHMAATGSRDPAKAAQLADEEMARSWGWTWNGAGYEMTRLPVERTPAIASDGKVLAVPNGWQYHFAQGVWDRAARKEKPPGTFETEPTGLSGFLDRWVLPGTWFTKDIPDGKTMWEEGRLRFELHPQTRTTDSTKALYSIRYTDDNGVEHAIGESVEDGRGVPFQVDFAAPEMAGYRKDLGKAIDVARTTLVLGDMEDAEVLRHAAGSLAVRAQMAILGSETKPTPENEGLPVVGEPGQVSR